MTTHSPTRPPTPVKTVLHALRQWHDHSTDEDCSPTCPARVADQGVQPDTDLAPGPGHDLYTAAVHLCLTHLAAFTAAVDAMADRPENAAALAPDLRAHAWAARVAFVAAAVLRGRDPVWALALCDDDAQAELTQTVEVWAARADVAAVDPTTHLVRTLT